jgi:hypothetical protein
MGLLEGPQKPAGRRGDLALILAVVYGVLEGYRAISPAQAADSGLYDKVEQLSQRVQAMDVKFSVAIAELKRR